MGSLAMGSGGVQRHPFFRGLDFNALLSRTAISPHIPAVSGVDDTSMFAVYGNRSTGGMEAISTEEQELFRRFSTHAGAASPEPEEKETLVAAAVTQSPMEHKFPTSSLPQPHAGSPRWI